MSLSEPEMTQRELDERLEPILLALCDLEEEIERRVQGEGVLWHCLDIAQFALQRMHQIGGNQESDLLDRIEARGSLKIPIYPTPGYVPKPRTPRGGTPLPGTNPPREDQGESDRRE